MPSTHTALATVTVGAGGASSISFTNIPSTYTDLKLILSTRDSGAFTYRGVFANINSDGAGTNTNAATILAENTTRTGSTTSLIAQGASANSTANSFGNIEIYFGNYLTTGIKPYITTAAIGNNSTNGVTYMLGGRWNNAALLTSIVLTPQSTPFVQYTTATLYGIFNTDTANPPATMSAPTALALNASAAVSFTPVSGAASYTATSTPGSFTATSSVSPILVSGLSNGTSYTFTVKANNPNGSSANSAASNSVTPSAGTPYDVLLGTAGSPYINAYVFSNGWGSKYANPATLPTQTAAAVSFAPNKTALIIAEDGSSPYVSAYAWSSGFGSKYSNPATAPAGRRLGADFRGGSVAVGFGGDSPSPWVDAYPWSSGFGSKYSNPSTLGTGGFSVRWSPDGTVFSSSNNSASPYLAAWAWSGGFGSKYSNPATNPGNATYGQAWTPSSNAIVYSVGSSPYLVAYPWSGGYGTKYADPATLPPALPGRVLNFNPAGNVLVAANSSSPYVIAYAWSSGFGTKYADPGVGGPSTGENAFFTPDGNAVIQSGQGSPNLNAWAWSGGFSVKYPAPATLISAVGYGLDVK